VSAARKLWASAKLCTEPLNIDNIISYDFKNFARDGYFVASDILEAFIASDFSKLKKNREYPPNTHKHTNIHIHTHNTHSCTHTHPHTHTHTHTYTHNTHTRSSLFLIQKFYAKNLKIKEHCSI
jgi:hypothetical protein